MITLIATALLSMAAMKGDAVDNARKAFNNCMIEVHNVAVSEKVTPSAFIKHPIRHARQNAQPIRRYW